MYIRSKVWADVATCLGGCGHMPACSTTISFKAGLDVIRRYILLKYKLSPISYANQ